jgi:FeS assembly SUF system regulator
MVRLSKLNDYAVVLLTQMVRRDGKVATTATMAEATGLPHPTVSKVLKILAKGGLLTAQRGATGGYVLSRTADAISVADIITAMDGPIALTDCVEGSHQSCQMEKSCPINGHWNRVNNAIRGALQSVSLAQMASDAPPVQRHYDFIQNDASHHTHL